MQFLTATLAFGEILDPTNFAELRLPNDRLLRALIVTR